MKIEESVISLSRALQTLTEAFKQAFSPFLQRPLMYLVGHTVTTLHLLEHAIWGHSQEFAKGHWKVDSNIFKRYVGNTLESLRIDLETSMQVQDDDTRRKEDVEIVYRAGALFSKL